MKKYCMLVIAFMIFFCLSGVAFAGQSGIGGFIQDLADALWYIIKEIIRRSIPYPILG